MCRIADLRPYAVIVAGVLEPATVAEICPPDTRVCHDHGATTLLIARADQAALIGVLRQLHNLGYTLLRVDAAAGVTPRGDQDSTPRAVN